MSKRLADPLPRRRLGRTNLEVTALGLGGAPLGGAYGNAPEQDAIETVHDALEQGINVIDTSPLYGDSERRIGLALEGIPRDSFILSTKTGTHPKRRGDYSWDATMWSVENSLRLLKTDVLDVVHVHDPDSLEPVFAPRGALDALEELKRLGVIRAIGLGQRHHDFHRRALESGRFDVILTYNDYHPLRTTALELLPLAQSHDVGILNGSPLAHGLLVGGNPRLVNATLVMPGADRDVRMARRLYDWCRAKELPMTALCLQFCLRQPGIHCTLSGSKTVEELRRNLRAVTFPFPDDVWEELDALCLAEGQI